MKDAHTPGPWEASYRGDMVLAAAGEPPAGALAEVAKVYGWSEHADLLPQVANAKRIVACVNACEGMADPGAEVVALQYLVDDGLQELEAGGLQKLLDGVVAACHQTGELLAIAARVSEEMGLALEVAKGCLDAEATGGLVYPEPGQLKEARELVDAALTTYREALSKEARDRADLALSTWMTTPEEYWAERTMEKAATVVSKGGGGDVVRVLVRASPWLHATPLGGFAKTDGTLEMVATVGTPAGRALLALDVKDDIDLFSWCGWRWGATTPPANGRNK
jgi:hypothetical protein